MSGKCLTILKSVVLCPLLILFSSCTRHYSISVNTYSDKQFIPNGFPPGSTFSVAPGNDTNPMFSKEVTEKISQILRNRGYEIADFNKADYILVFNTAITSSTTMINVPKYVPGQTQTKSGAVYGTYGYAGSYNEKTESSGSTVYVPEEYTYFTRGVGIFVYDAKLYRKKKIEEQVWSGMAISSGENSDLRDVVDYLLVSVFGYFGQNTKKNIDIYMSDRNQHVKQLRGELGVIPFGLEGVFQEPTPNSSSE